MTGTTVASRADALPFAVGLLAALGTLSGGYVVADAALGALAVVLLAFGRRPHRAMLILAAGAALTALWSAAPELSLWWAGRVMALGIVTRGAPASPLAAGFLAGLAVHLAMLGADWPDRAEGLMLNAVAVSIVGAAMWHAAPHLDGVMRWAYYAAGGASVVMSGSRSALLALLPAFGSLRMAAALALLCAAFAGAWLARLDPGTVERHLETRRAQYHGELTWLGTGVGGHNVEHGPPRPHFVPLLVVYEWGVLAVIPFGLGVWVVWSGAVDRRLAASFVLLGLFQDGVYAAPHGLYAYGVALAIAAAPERGRELAPATRAPSWTQRATAGPTR